MGLYELNRIRTVGVLPTYNADPIPVGKIPDGGTQVVASVEPNNSTLELHTVTAAKTLYLSCAVLGAHNASEVRSEVSIVVTNNSDVIQYDLLKCSLPVSGLTTESVSAMPPIEVPATWKVKAISNVDSVFVKAFIHGYEA